MSRKTVDAARGRWPGILRAMGVDEAFLRNRHGPCPMCGGKDRYRFDDFQQAGGYHCNSCGSGDGMALLMGITGKTFSEVAKSVDELLGNVEIKEAPAKPAGPDPRVRLRAVAESLVPVDGINPVRIYLKSRGIHAPSPVTKLCQRMPYYENGMRLGNYAAMVHLVSGVHGEPLSYHVTYLADGGKAPVSAPKKMLPPLAPMAGGAIRLFPPAKIMGIAEGVETAYVAADRYDVPVWAAATADMLQQWVPPPEAELVWIFADNDRSFTGQAAAYALAKRLARTLQVIVVMPKEIGTDFADEVVHA